jgi:hypothetical protein
MGNFEAPQPVEPDPIEDAKWHRTEAEVFSDAAREAAEQGDNERARELSKKASESRIKMNLDILDKLRGRK